MSLIKKLKGLSKIFWGLGRAGDGWERRNFFKISLQILWKSWEVSKIFFKKFIFGPKQSNFLPKCHFFQCKLSYPNSFTVSWPVYLNPEKILFSLHFLIYFVLRLSNDFIYLFFRRFSFLFLISIPGLLPSTFGVTTYFLGRTLILFQSISDITYSSSY